MKNVQVIAHSFNSLPGHVTISGRGKGSNLRVALQRAVGNLFLDHRLTGKRTTELKLSVVVEKAGA
jgi:hypothetical protein